MGMKDHMVVINEKFLRWKKQGCGKTSDVTSDQSQGQVFPDV